MKWSKKGQSVLEYVLLITAIIAIIAVAARGPISAAVSSLMDSAASSIDTAAGNMP